MEATPPPTCSLYARCAPGGLTTIAVEGKVSESFDKLAREWIAARGNLESRHRRVNGLAALLELRELGPGGRPYQLLHRAVVALRFNAARAVLLVHSFAPERAPGRVPEVAGLFDLSGEPGVVQSVGPATA